jgi:hypothetical protein
MLRTAFAVVLAVAALCGVAVAQMPFGVQTVILDKPATSPAIDLNLAAGTSATCSSIAACISISRTGPETCEIPGATTISIVGTNTGCTGGLQVFQAGTNLVPHSQDTTNWTVPSAGGSVTNNNAVAPDGTMTAFTLTDNSTNVVHTARSPGFTSTAGHSYVWSAFISGGTCSGTTTECHTGIITMTLTGTPVLMFDAADCTIHGSRALSATTLDIQKIFTPEKFFGANGNWCRFAFVYTPTSSGTANIEIGMEQGISNGVVRLTAYVGGGSTMNIWGADVKDGTQLLPYCATTTAAATCNADVVTATGPLKTYLEGSAARAVFTTSQIFGQQPQAGIDTGGGVAATAVPQTLLGTGTALTGLGINNGYQLQTTWPVTTTLTTVGQIVPGIQTNNFGLSIDASGRSLAINGQTAVSDSNGLSATSTEYIGSISSGANYCNCVMSRIQAWATRNDAAMLAATANANVLPLVASYTGSVATNTRIPQFDLGVNIAMTRSHHRLTQNITSLQALFSNYIAVSLGETSPAHAATIAASVEYPLGTCHAFTFSASSTGTIPNGGDLTTDALTISLPAGADIWIRSWRQMAGGGIVMPATGIDRQQLELTTTAGADLTATCGAMTGNQTANNYRPTALLASVQWPTYCTLGDSRVNGNGDLELDLSGLWGELDRWIGPYYNVLNMGVGGDRALNFVGDATNRKNLFQYCTGMVVNFGVNDTYGGVTAAATTYSNLTTIYGYSTTLLHGTPGLSHVWQVTIASEDNSTSGNYLGPADETTKTNTSILNTLNGLIVGNGAGIAGVFDNITNVQNGSGLWLGNGTTTFGYTVDGIHGSTNTYFTIKNSHPFPMGLQ